MPDGPDQRWSLDFVFGGKIVTASKEKLAEGQRAAGKARKAMCCSRRRMMLIAHMMHAKAGGPLPRAHHQCFADRAAADKHIAAIFARARAPGCETPSTVGR